MSDLDMDPNKDGEIYEISHCGYVKYVNENDVVILLTESSDRRRGPQNKNKKWRLVSSLLIITVFITPSKRQNRFERFYSFVFSRSGLKKLCCSSFF